MLYFEDFFYLTVTFLNFKVALARIILIDWAERAIIYKFENAKVHNLSKIFIVASQINSRTTELL